MLARFATPEALDDFKVGLDRFMVGLESIGVPGGSPGSPAFEWAPSPSAGPEIVTAVALQFALNGEVSRSLYILDRGDSRVMISGKDRCRYTEHIPPEISAELFSPNTSGERTWELTAEYLGKWLSPTWPTVPPDPVKIEKKAIRLTRLWPNGDAGSAMNYFPNGGYTSMLCATDLSGKELFRVPDGLVVIDRAPEPRPFVGR